MRAVGREAVLDRISRTIDGAAEEALLVTGEYGSGRSRLLSEALTRATTPGALVRGNPSEAAWPLSGFSTVLATIDDARAIEFGGRFVLRSTEPGFMFAAAADLLAMLRGLRLGRRTVFIDDIDLMDVASQTLIGFMAARLAGTGLRIIATARPSAATGPLAGLPRCRLAPLDDEESLLFAEALTEQADEGTLRLVAAYSGGNPAALTANIRSLSLAQLAGRAPLRLPFPPTHAADAIGEAVTSRLGSEHLAVLFELAAAPVSSRCAIAEGAADAADALDDLRDAGVAHEEGEYVAIRHPLVRSAVYWSLGSRARRELHERCAARNDGVDARFAVWHRSFFGTPELEHTSALLAAAVSLAHDGNPWAAAEFADRARLRAPAPDDEITPLLDLASSLFLQGERALAARYLEPAGAESRGPAGRRGATGDAASGRVRMRLAIARLRVRYTGSQRIPDSDIDSPVALHGDGDPDGATRLLTTAACFHALQWETATARRALERAAPYLDRSSRVAIRLRDTVAGLVDATAGSPGASPPTDAPAFGDLAGSSVAELLALARTFTLREEYALAGRMYSVVLDVPPAPDPVWADLARLLLADNDVRSGHLHDARTSIRRARSAALPQVHWPQRDLLDAWSAAIDGRVPDAREQLRSWLRTHAESAPVELAQALGLQGALALLDGDAEEAVRSLTRADLVGARFSNPSLLRHAPDLVDALVLCRRFEEARAAVERFANATRDHPGRWATLALARTRALVAPPRESVAVFDRAIAAFRPDDSPFELGKTLAAKAARLAALGAPAAATIVDARAAFDAAGARAWARRLGESRDIPSTATAGAPATTAVPPRLFELLSRDEQEVALLVQEGYRNKEIAAQLYVSVRTVELRLTHIYRKVGARSRSHLAAMFT